MTDEHKLTLQQVDQDEWPTDDPYYASIAETCRRAGISRQQWEAHQRAVAEQASLDQKAPTWALALLYPVSAFLLWVGLSPPGTGICAVAQRLLITISGVWITWVSVRLLIRERWRYRVWVHYALGALGFGGLVAVIYAIYQR